MTRTKIYRDILINAECMRRLEHALEHVLQTLPASAYTDSKPELENSRLRVDRGDESWSYDNYAEFVLELNMPYKHAEGSFRTHYTNESFQVSVRSDRAQSLGTEISIYTGSRDLLMQLANLVDEVMTGYGYRSPPSPTPVVFIGHGHSTAWRELKDHLSDKHGFKVECFESDTRAGSVITHVLEKMLKSASIALLIMTAEDGMPDGNFRARQNVIHEIGLFQGRLGFDHVVVLLEEGTEEFSNIDGLQQIRFARNRIQETFGEVVATLNRYPAFSFALASKDGILTETNGNNANNQPGR